MLVAEDRAQPPRNYAIRGQLAGQRVRDAELLKLAVKPVRKLAVLVAVAEECIISRLQPRHAWRVRLRLWRAVESPAIGQASPCAAPSESR